MFRVEWGWSGGLGLDETEWGTQNVWGEQERYATNFVKERVLDTIKLNNLLIAVTWGLRFRRRLQNRRQLQVLQPWHLAVILGTRNVASSSQWTDPKSRGTRQQAMVRSNKWIHLNGVPHKIDCFPPSYTKQMDNRHLTTYWSKVVLEGIFGIRESSFR